MTKLAVIVVLGFLAWQVGARLYLGYVYNSVAAKVQHGNGADLRLNFSQPPELEHAFRDLNERGFPTFDKPLFPSQDKSRLPSAGYGR